jgi:hypothetical protein
MKALMRTIPNIDPAASTIKHFTCLHAAADVGKVKAIKTVLKFFKRRVIEEYVKLKGKSENKIDDLLKEGSINTRLNDPELQGQIDAAFRKVIDLKSKNHMQTALHIAVIRSNSDLENKTSYDTIVKTLIMHQANLKCYDVRCWTPYDYCYKDSLAAYLESEDEKLKASFTMNADPRTKDGTVSDDKEMRIFKFDYQFCIISKVTDPDPKNNAVFRQLMNIKYNHRKLGKLRVKCFNEILNSKNEFIYTIYFPRQIINYYVDKLDYTIYSMRKKYHCNFISSIPHEYEPIKEYYARNIIFMILMQEFNLEEYKAEEVISSYFNLHDFDRLKSINDFWREAMWATFENFFSLKIHPNTSRFVISIGMYFGCSVGLFYGLITHYLKWLLIPCFLAICVTIIRYFDNENYRIFCLFNALALCLWIPMFMAKWYQAERRLAYGWSTHRYDKEEVVRAEYTGFFVIDPVSKEIVQRAAWSAFKKRIFVDFPVTAMGFGLVISLFALTVYLEFVIQQYRKDLKIDDNLAFILS